MNIQKKKNIGIDDDADSVVGAASSSAAGSVTGIPTDAPTDIPTDAPTDEFIWPSMQDLNTRLRRVITSYQRNYKKEELKQQQKAKVNIFYKICSRVQKNRNKC